MTNKKIKKTKKFISKEKTESGIRIARGLGIVALALYVITVIIGYVIPFVGNDIVASVCCALGIVMAAVSHELYHKYGKASGLDSFICVMNWIPVALLWIVIILLNALLSANDSKSNKSETKKIGDGYVEEGEYGTYYMYVNNGAGYDKISLKDYNSATGDALDFDGNSYKIG